MIAGQRENPSAAELLERPSDERVYHRGLSHYLPAVHPHHAPALLVCAFINGFLLASSEAWTCADHNAADATCAWLAAARRA